MLKNFLPFAAIAFLILIIGMSVLLYKARMMSPSYNNPPTPVVSINPVASPSPTVKPTDGNDYMSWKIETVCLPIQSWQGAGFEPIIDLKDGTLVYKRKDGSLFRGTTNRCKCLASSTNISTSLGKVNIKQLKIGMLVWTVDKNGQREIQPIIKLNSVYVGDNYKISHLKMVDGRNLLVSSTHPISKNHLVSDLSTGDSYDGSVVQSNSLISYDDKYTYDLLPAGETGFYFANGILMGSTLK